MTRTAIPGHVTPTADYRALLEALAADPARMRAPRRAASATIPSRCSTSRGCSAARDGLVHYLMLRAARATPSPSPGTPESCRIRSAGFSPTATSASPPSRCPATCEPEGYLAEKRKGNVRVARRAARRRRSSTHIDYVDATHAPAAAQQHRGRAPMNAKRRPRIAVIGSNMVDLVTYVNRMPVRGETVEAPSFEMGHGGKGANQAVAAAKLGAVGDDGHQGRRRHVRRQYDPQSRALRRRHETCRRACTAAPAASRRSWSSPRGENSILIVKGANDDLSPADIERAGRGSQDLRPHPAAARSSARDGLCGDRLRQAPRREDAAQPGARDAELDPERIRDVDLPRSQRDRTRDPHRPAGRERRREIADGGAQPHRQGNRDRHRDDGRARRAAADRRRARPIAPVRVDAGRHHRRRRRLRRQLRALLCRGRRRSRRRWTRRCATPPISITRRGTQKAYADESEFDAFCAGLPANS